LLTHRSWMPSAHFSGSDTPYAIFTESVI